MGKPLVLGYWDIRGLAAPIRLLLAHSGVAWEDKLYVTGPAPTYDKTGWFSAKPNLGLAFPNNPYLVDEDAGVKLVQSKAILRYLGRRHGLVPQTDAEWIRVDQAEFEEFDLRDGFASLCYNPDFEQARLDWAKNLKVKLDQWNTFIGAGPWIAGVRLTYVDFSLFDILDQIMHLEKNALDGFPGLQDFMARFGNLEKVAAFMKSDRYIKYPLNNRMAKFGG